MALHYFDKHLHEANEFIVELASNLGHPEDTTQTIRLLKATLHTIRDRIHIGESLDLISQFPMMLKALYVEGWKYNEKPPLDFDDIEGFKNEVKKLQDRLGEQSFDWSEPTEDLIKIIMSSLQKYISDGQAIHVISQMPKEVQQLF